MIDPKLKAWSYSRLQTYEQCPKKYHHMNILKDVKADFTGPEAEYGKAAHKACERYVRDGVALPERFKHYKRILDKIRNAKGQVYCELNLCLNENLEKTGWFDADAYVRAIIDVCKVNKTAAFIGDYKTGKMKDDPDQLMLNAAVLFAYFPEVTKVTTAFIWLKDMHITKDTYTRDELDFIWGELLPRAKRIEHSIEHESWGPRTSGLCGWCDVKKQGKCDFG